MANFPRSPLSAKAYATVVQCASEVASCLDQLAKRKLQSMFIDHVGEEIRTDSFAHDNVQTDFWEMKFNNRSAHFMLIIAFHVVMAFFYDELPLPDERERAIDRAKSFAYLVVSILSIAIVCLSLSPAVRKLLQRHYEAVLSVYILSLYACIVLFNSRLEMQKSKLWFLHSHIARLDSQYQETASFPGCYKYKLDDDCLESSCRYEVRCSTFYIGGECIALFILAPLLPRFFQLCTTTTLALNGINTILLLGFSFLLGSLSWKLLLVSIIQNVIAAASAFSGSLLNRREWQQFLLSRQSLVAIKQSRSLIYTLIPENVLQKMETCPIKDFLGVSIPSCTIMFCSLEPQKHLKARSTTKTFKLLNEVFEMFDDVVDHYGMYKYQHVGDWYIITCPRAAKPFDEAEQSLPYPQSYAVQMVKLANELRELAQFYTVEGVSLQLKVGMNHGTIAGAVIGHHRAFYCVYGDTANTAARMCKYAEPNEVLCTQNFAELIKDCGDDYCSCVYKGDMDIKGKGRMEVFKIKADGFDFCHSFSHGGVCKLNRFGKQNLKLEDSEISWSHCCSASSSFSRKSKACLDVFTRFKDANLESEFRRESSSSKRIALMSGLVVHLCAVVCHVHLIVRQASWERDKTSLVLVLLHMVVAVVAIGFLLRFACRVQKAGRVKSGLFLLKILFLLLATILCFLDSRHDRILFSVSVYLVFHSIPSGIDFRQVVELASVVLFSVLISTLPGWQGEGGGTSCCLGQLALVMMSGLFLSYRLELHERLNWLAGRTRMLELRNLQGILLDLLPEKIVHKMIHSPLTIQSDLQTAVILQLDICSFTKMSQTMGAIDVARMVHKVFSQFDDRVQQLQLFKMDTVGDAYIVTGWLPCEQDWVTAESTHRKCQQVLSLARHMIFVLQRFREEEGIDLNCRIGLCLGVVVAGVLGKAQSRFHLMGKGMETCEQLEQSSGTNCVHASDAFLQCATPSGWERRGRSEQAGYWEQHVDVPQGWRMEGWTKHTSDRSPSSVCETLEFPLEQGPEQLPEMARSYILSPILERREEDAEEQVEVK